MNGGINSPIFLELSQITFTTDKAKFSFTVTKDQLT